MQVISDGFRFSLAGIVNTLLTFILYQLLVFWFPPLVAYWLVWSIGIVFVMVLFPSYVYRGSRLTLKNATILILLYLFTLAIGSMTLHWLNDNDFSMRAAIVVVILITSAVNFLLSRLLFRGRVFSCDDVGQDK